MNLIATLVIVCWLAQQIAAHTVGLTVCQDATDSSRYLLLMHSYHGGCPNAPQQTITFEETINGVPQGDRQEELTREVCYTSLAQFETEGVCAPGTTTSLDPPCDTVTCTVGNCNPATWVKTGIMAFTPTALCGQSYGIELKVIVGSQDYSSCVPRTAIPLNPCLGFAFVVDVVRTRAPLTPKLS
jgi:hypothetical protein